MPFEIEPWLSDADIQSWFDDQEKWYLRLLLQAWKNSAKPCHLPNEPERLATLAGVSAVSPERVRAWRDRGPAVLRKFVSSEDGKWLFSPKQLEVYEDLMADDWRIIRQRILKRDEYMCGYCGATASQVDHIIPSCQGGTEVESNLLAACAPCNLRKGSRTPSQAVMPILKGRINA